MCSTGNLNCSIISLSQFEFGFFSILFFDFLKILFLVNQSFTTFFTTLKFLVLFVVYIILTWEILVFFFFFFIKSISLYTKNFIRLFIIA